MICVKEKDILMEVNIVKADEKKDKEYISRLNATTDKVKYLRFVKHYTQSKVAEMIGISKRHVIRVEKKLKNTI
ncbi:Sporulation sigma factor SigF [Clostridium neonatale]|uniref:Sporulation sigma factor SigF n=1 Tax=Clostridium neonatale TaxID=137838 RepID=A0AAD1YC54_9CLOT|nr:Sporulation sigma factor SigF [Clostridium neonatale]CAI3204673.1 Sporulation sigma factor SigF [Clostridium neonatale]CAI3210124.1 Sporulation sigma factor SigF [Clostridium neonatale]CAI3213929.1 Sporulation sigma factor SigF [Clostridium neonatale]CAI3220347.1 Sporulation sigma factor SigF [Clostridium neonatale]